MSRANGIELFITNFLFPGTYDNDLRSEQSEEHPRTSVPTFSKSFRCVSMAPKDRAPVK